ncbi:MAG: pyruvate dehydrogenase complex dihydrolipoyllysine-residue acetyltransferase, partial [Porticoccus sp.]|nr:pyruvate dehydrogenase complex dihydrolipoyllysine-residue acetyltransferase [Porticoccus sp.]
MTTDIIHVPDLGGAETVEVIELCVAPGDTVELEQSLIVLESDKATMDVPSPKAGIVKALIVKEGDTVSEGSAILELE